MRGPKRPLARRIGKAWLVGAVVAMSLAAAGTATAQDATLWQNNKGDCDSILSDPQFFTLDEVRACVQRWESYGHPDILSRSEAQAYARGFSRLHYQGSRRDQSLAESALSRLGLSVLPRGDFVPNEELEAFLNRNRSPIPVEQASSRNRRRARDSNADGMREYNRGNYESAASDFRAALNRDPFYILAKYNLACQLALLGDTDEALETLIELSRWDSGDARQQVARARTDEDLSALRDDPRFRILTGYARIQVLNGAASAGVERATEIKDGLVAEGYDVVSFGYDRHLRARPVVYHGRGYGDIAEDVAALVAGEGPPVDTRMTNWSSEYDLVVVWGAEIQGAMQRPLVQGVLSIEGGDPQEFMDELQEAAEDIPDAIEDPEAAVEEWQPEF